MFSVPSWSEAEKGDADAAEIAEVVSAAAGATVTAAYQISQVHGDVTRQEVVQEVSRQRRRLAPELQRQLSEVGERLSKEVAPRKSILAWRSHVPRRAPVCFALVSATGPGVPRLLHSLVLPPIDGLGHHYLLVFH